ncbi:MAG: O-methyltransferase [Chitinophagaceae bacterium]|nr:O-methyltransferase [Chitinophagaceae bacterium]MDP1762299.1 O-methyltransferase [Sediminibacterium sp.]MDP1809822.1 O-methyltransferase [Sediminibacterium sp.]MDP3129470.1 O-methyltransferase [Sediminibacterium sp.]MDP3666141.1 O-methyltransferase [Sediminibacterium sp.]
MELIHHLAEAYAARFSSGEEALLAEVTNQTRQNHPHAHMLSGHVQGKFLSFISTVLQPEYILEIGTFTGYSAICLAEGLSADGELHTIEVREADAAIARENFSKYKRNNQIHLHLGDAREIIPGLNHPWDLVFIDADKTSYIDYYEMVIPRLSEKGIVLADNVLFHGEVLQEPVSGKNAKAIQAFNEHVMNDKRTEQVLVTIRDGILLIKKRSK